jgi:hypothetical protein
MATIETKFNIGDVVYHATVTTERRSHPCPDCLGTRKWKAVSPAGAEFSFGCPRCGGQYHAKHDLTLDYSWWVPTASKRTIGSIKANTDKGDSYDGGNTYMCHETGIGSGSIYREAELFLTKEGALAHAQLKADEQNANPDGWVAKQYAGTLEVCDYELESAAIKAAESKAWSMGYDVRSVLDEVEMADDLEDAKLAVERFRNRAEAA